MRVRQVVRVNVSKPDGSDETVFKAVNGKYRSRFLRRLVGDKYAVLVITPVGRHVDAVEIHESREDEPE